MESTVKQRLKEFIAYLGIGQGKFEKSANLSNGYVNNISKGIGVEKLQSILCIYPELNQDWLLTGEGDMLLSSQSGVMPEPERVSDEVTTVLLLPVYAHGGTFNEFAASVQANDCEKIVSPVQGADYAIQITGDSMAPEYPNGARILIKKIDESAFIEWGKTYVLDTCNGVVVKNLFPTETPSVVQCRSINTDYPPFEVDMSNIYGVYRVLVCMSIK